MSELTMQHDKRQQAEYLRRILFAALAGGIAHTLVCWFALQLDFFRGSKSVFTTLFTFLWLGHVAMVSFMLVGLNRKLKDPSMTLPLMVWSTLGLLISAYFVDQIRLCVMVIFFAILQLGVFRVQFREFLWVAAFCVVGYGLIIVLVSMWYPEANDWTAELIQWVAFSVMTAALVIVAGEISGIRVQLGFRNRQLESIVTKIHEMAIKDELTGMYNRRHALEQLTKMKELADRGAFQFVVGYVDLDHFKRVNDNYGHAVGDDVLKTFSRLLRSTMTDRDFCARFGGEEFIFVLAQCDLEEAALFAERLRKMVSELSYESEPELRMTVSMGVAQYTTHEEIESVLKRADDQLYRAKNTGRNKVCK